MIWCPPLSIKVGAINILIQALPFTWKYQGVNESLWVCRLGSIITLWGTLSQRPKFIYLYMNSFNYRIPIHLGVYTLGVYTLGIYTFSGHGFWIWPRTYLVVYTLGVYILGVYIFSGHGFWIWSSTYLGVYAIVRKSVFRQLRFSNTCTGN